MRLKYTIGRVVLVLLSPLLLHSLLSLPLVAKFILVAISPTIATMKPYGLRLRLVLGLLTWFISTRLLNRFLLTSLFNPFLVTRLLTLFPKEHFPQSAHELDRLLEIVDLWRKHGWSWGCVYSFPMMVRFRDKSIFVEGFWWLWDILSASLTNLVCPKSLNILALMCLDHYPQLRLMTRQPTHQLSQLIILILQTINIMCKFQVL
jgi:hypothetical protein